MELASFMPSTCLAHPSEGHAWRELSAKTVPHVAGAVVRLTIRKQNLTGGNKEIFD